MTDRDPARVPDVLARGSGGALLIGIGGGGDVVGALTIARGLEAAGRRVEVGGVAWERFAVDPHHAGPRPLGHLDGIELLGGGAALTGAAGSTPEGVRLAEAGVAAHLGRATALVDVNDGPTAVGEAVVTLADRLECDLVVLLDVGGDVLATGSEPGLSSPLCDALMLAAARHLPERLEVVGCAYGSGCDGELTADGGPRPGRRTRPRGQLARDRLARAEGRPARRSRSPPLSRPRPACSRRAAHSARAAPTPIRGGRRTVELGPVGALGFVFGAREAIGAAAPLAELIADAGSIEEARAAMEALGIRTELDYERERVAGLDG